MPAAGCGAGSGAAQRRFCYGQIGIPRTETRALAACCRALAAERSERRGVGTVPPPAAPGGCGGGTTTGGLNSQFACTILPLQPINRGGFGSLHTWLVGPRPPAGGTTSRRMFSMNQQRHGACSVSEKAKLCAGVLICMALVGCARDRVTPVYDAGGAIRRIDYDTDHDGRIDMRAYLANGQTVRIEADGNGDGVVDRWEYYGAGGGLDRLGTSSESDGIEDIWVVQTGDQMRVDISTRRNGVADRHELHEHGITVRAEQDTDGDGRIDQWQRFDHG